MVKGIKKVLVSGFVACLVLATALTAQAAPARPYAGADRYDTANKILAEGWTSANTAILASGEHLADALSVAPLAKKENAPLVFVKPMDNASLDQAVSKLVSLGVKKVYIATGTGVISKDAETKLAAKNIEVKRLGGADRYETALNIAKQFGPSSKLAVVTTNNEVYADAVSIAPIAAVEGMPVLFTDGQGLTPAVKDYITNTLKPTSSYVISGPAVVSDKVKDMLPNATRIAGADRYETNFKVIDAFKADLKFDTVYVAGGEVFADALAASPYAAKTSSPIVLAYNDLNTQTASLLKANMFKNGTIKVVGGAAGVLSAVDAKLQNVLDNAKPVAVTTGKATVNVNFNAALPAIKQVTVNSTVAGAAKYKVGSSAVVALGEKAQLFYSDTKAADLTVYAADGTTVVATGTIDLATKGDASIDVKLADVVIVVPADGKATVNVNFNAALPAIKQVTVSTIVAGAAKYKVGSSAVVALGEKAQLFYSETTAADLTVYAADGTTVVATGKVDLAVKGDASVTLTVNGTTTTPVVNAAKANVNFNAALPAIKQVTLTGTVNGAAKYSVGTSAVVAIGEKAQLFYSETTPAAVKFFAADGTTVVATSTLDLGTKGDVTLTVTAK